MTTKKKILFMGKVSANQKAFTLKYLPADAEIIFYEQEGDREKHIATADILVAYNVNLTKDWIEKADKCRLTQRLGVGVNAVDIPAASRRGIPIAITAGKNARSVAEHAVMLMLAVYKNVTMAHINLVQQGKWLKNILRDRSYELSHKEVGIVGLGNIGREVAQLLQSFACELSYYDVVRAPAEVEKALNLRYSDLDSLLQQSDVVTIHAPATPETIHLINEKRLRSMKPNAILINCSRGELIDEVALVKVLQSGQLLGAGLDVFETEPMPADHPLTKLENVVLTPHTAGGTVEAVEAVIQDACENINCMLKDGTVANEKSIVNWNDVKGKVAVAGLR